MIQNTTFLRRAVGSLLVALVTLVGFQANAQFNFTQTTNVAWDEDHTFDDTSNALDTGGGQSLIDLNGRVTAAGTPTATACYVLSGTATYALDFSGTKDCRADGAATGTMQGVLGSTGLTLAIKANQHVDFERGASQTLILTGYTGAGATRRATEMLTVNIAVTDHDESPVSTQTAATIPTWYLSEGDSRTLLISSLFRDPEGAPVYFDTSTGSTDVWVCDSSAAGDTTIGAAPPANAIATAPGDDVTIDTSANTNAGCSVSNGDATTETPSPGVPGSAGNRVVTTRKSRSDSSRHC